MVSLICSADGLGLASVVCADSAARMALASVHQRMGDRVLTVTGQSDSGPRRGMPMANLTRLSQCRRVWSSCRLRSRVCPLVKRRLKRTLYSLSLRGPSTLHADGDPHRRSA
jgi:hypothetical protein